MKKNKLNLRNVVAIAICFTAMTMFVSCDKDDQAKKSIVGKWSITPSYNSVVEITESNINFIIESDASWSYKWVSDNSIEIARSRSDHYTTRNEVIFHTLDSITIKDFWMSGLYIDPPTYIDATLTRINLQN